MRLFRGALRAAGMALCLFGALASGSCGFAAQEPEPRAGSIDPAEAERCFREAKAISDRDGGRMWGAPLYGSTLFVDPETRDVVANRPDYQGRLVRKGTVFTGRFPPEENAANTSMRWLGVTWTVLRWPLPDDPFDRGVLMIHESFHSVQEQLGLGGPDTPGDHLDTRDGRVWIQLEWRALRKALTEAKGPRQRAVQDALLFRAFRRALFQGSADKERSLEICEGLPEFTGVALTARNRAEAEAHASARLLGASSHKTFVRSFAYVSGPAYGLLLDQAAPGWRKGLKPQDDLGDLLGKAFGVTLPADPKTAAEGRTQVYGGKELMAFEDQLVAKKARELEALRARFVDGPVLLLPITEAFTYTFDPTDQVPLEGVGTFYSYFRISSSWGTLDATAGALALLRDSTISGVRVTAPKDAAARPLRGDGWTLTLKPGWEVAPGGRPGDFDLKKKPSLVE